MFILAKTEFDLGTIANPKYINPNELKQSFQQDALKQLEKQAKTVFNRVNKRIRNLERNNSVVSPAYNALVQKRGNAPRFGLKGSYSDLKSLEKEYNLALSFDTMETSTVAGARAYTNNLKSHLPLDKMSKELVANVFDVLHGLHERMPDVIYNNTLQYTDYLETVLEVAENRDFNNMSRDELETSIVEAVQRLAEKTANDINESTRLLNQQFNRLF